MLNEAIKAANHTFPETEESTDEAVNVASELSFLCVSAERKDDNVGIFQIKTSNLHFKHNFGRLKDSDL